MFFGSGGDNVSFSVQLAADFVDEVTLAAKIEEEVSPEGEGEEEVEEDVRHCHRREQQDGQRVRRLQEKVLFKKEN